MNPIIQFAMIAVTASFAGHALASFRTRPIASMLWTAIAITWIAISLVSKRPDALSLPIDMAMAFMVGGTAFQFARRQDARTPSIG